MKEKSANEDEAISTYKTGCSEEMNVSLKLTHIQQQVSRNNTSGSITLENKMEIIHRIKDCKINNICSKYE